MARGKLSAGLVAYRFRAGSLEVLLVHPGGPFWARKDEGAWSIPKGELDGSEDALAAACREFREETGFEPQGPFIALGSARQKSGKVVHAWGFAGDFDPSELVSNTIEIEWPPRSGRRLTIPEVDRAAWLDPAGVEARLNPGQIPLIFALRAVLEKKIGIAELRLLFPHRTTKEVFVIRLQSSPPCG